MLWDRNIKLLEELIVLEVTDGVIREGGVPLWSLVMDPALVKNLEIIEERLVSVLSNAEYRRTKGWCR